MEAEGRAVESLLAGPDAGEADAALHRLPFALQDRLTAMSPVHYLMDVRAPLIVLLHDRDDDVIPVGESRRLRAELGGRIGVTYTEFTVFKHLDPTKGHPARLALAQELIRFARAIYPMFQRASRLPAPTGEADCVAFDTHPQGDESRSPR